MGFKSYENSDGMIKEGEYEVYVKDCCETMTKSGTPCIKFEFVIRSDVPQLYQNKHKFKNFYRDRITGEWPEEKIGRFANALGIPKGEDFELEDLNGRNCIMVITHFTTEGGETMECIRYLAPSKVEPYISKEPAGYSDLGDDDDELLPF